MTDLLLRSIAAAALIASTGVLAACNADVTVGGDKTIDTSGLEEDLAQQIAAKGVDPSDLPVDCPDDQEAEKGATFECTLTDLDGNERTIQVTLTDDDGGYDAEVVSKTPAGQ